eukprot:COSAG02_NODE_6240_length_3706_cov_2.443027_1_plen_1151_part_00
METLTGVDSYVVVLSTRNMLYPRARARERSRPRSRRAVVSGCSRKRFGALRCVMPTLLLLLHVLPVLSDIHKGFTSRRADNFLCNRALGGSPADYPLPCAAPASEWTSKKASEFVISAWWPPTISSSEDHADIDQLQEYKDAHFNLVLTGNVVGFCQHWNVTPTPATADQAFDCLAGALQRIDKAGLQATFTPGHYTSVTDMAGSAYGGAASFGGVTKRVQRTGSSLLSAPELGWIKQQLDAHNLTHVIAGMFLHDDDFTMTADTTHEVAFLHKHWPGAPGLTNGGTTDTGAAALYRSRQFVLSPEEYSVHGLTGDASAMAHAQMKSFQQNAYLTARYRLRAWPLFALGDGGAIQNIRSDSLVRVQVYSALAFGTQGLDYYCWGHGIWEMASPIQTAAKGSPSANYPFVKVANADAVRWGNMLIKSRHVGVIYSNQTNAKTAGAQPGVAPAPSLPVTKADSDLIIGVFNDGSDQTSDSGYLMIVDLRVGMSVGTVAKRTAKITLAPSCIATAVAPGVERTLESMQVQIDNSSISVSLDGGSGALFSVQGSGCGTALRRVREWDLHPREISMTDFKGSVTASPTRVGSAAGVPGGTQDRMSIIIGGSWEDGLCNGDSARALSESGFTALSVSAKRTNKSSSSRSSSVKSCSMSDSLIYAADYGLGLLASHNYQDAGADGGVASDADIIDAVSQYGCHTNFNGQILVVSSPSNITRAGNAAVDAVSPGGAVAAMRSAMHWGIPLAMDVSSVAQALLLADQHDLPLAAVTVPLSSSQSGHRAAQAVVDLYGELRTRIGRNSSAAASIAISISACGGSDDLLRFAAYASLPLLFEPPQQADGHSSTNLVGALWWDKLEKCAPIGSDRLSTIASINRRIFQKEWTASIAQQHKLSNSTTASVRVWSTSSTVDVKGCIKPGSINGGLVQSMDTELLLFEFLSDSDNSTSGTFYVISSQLSLSTTSERDVTIVTRKDIKSTQPVEGCSFEGASTPCDLHHIGNVLPLTLSGGAGQLVTYAAPPAPPPFAPPQPRPPPPPKSRYVHYNLELGPCATRHGVNNTWHYNSSTGALLAAWPIAQSHGSPYALVIDCGCFPGVPNPGCGNSPGCGNRLGPEPLQVTYKDWDETGSIASHNGVCRPHSSPTSGSSTQHTCSMR